MGRELHSTISNLQWVVTGYMLALATEALDYLGSY